jgi:HEAT repeat protein
MDNPRVAKHIAQLKDKNYAGRQKAAEAIVKIGPPAVQALIDALKNESRAVRWRAAEALGKIGDASAVPALIEVIKDGRVVGFLMGQCGPCLEADRHSCGSRLIEVLKEGDFYLRGRVAAELGQIGNASAFPH